MLNLTRRAIINFAKRLNKMATVSDVRGYHAENEPILSYLAGSSERAALQNSLDSLGSRTTDIPIVIGSKEFRTNDVKYQVEPFDHGKKISQFYYATPDLIEKAITESQEVRAEWERRPLEERADVFLKAADILAKQKRSDVNAATMLGQGKTAIQAEIDAACELIDFWRFNVMFALGLDTSYQPISTSESKNSIRYRGLEGFIAAISPFNFTAIGGNLCSAPALMGNVVLWKPSDTAMLSNWLVFNILREAGLPPGVVNFLPADGPTFGNIVTDSPKLAGVNFTGSVGTFRKLFKMVGEKIERYASYPRLVGECGGKNYHFIHQSADVQSVVNGTVRSAFEYSGQKCSACSRMYVPNSLWPEIRDKLCEEQKKIKVGSALEFDSFMSAVIDDKSFARIKGYVDHAKHSDNIRILAGGNYDDSKGYFVEPTIVECKDPNDKIMVEEIFGPVLSVYVYEDGKEMETLDVVRKSAAYGLTGAIFAQDRSFVDRACDILKMSAGNFYINDKSTGSVVGQQPFGGGRISGTNDKAGGPHYVLKWASPQSIKETSVPLGDWKYKYMEN